MLVENNLIEYLDGTHKFKCLGYVNYYTEYILIIALIIYYNLSILISYNKLKWDFTYHYYIIVKSGK